MARKFDPFGPCDYDWRPRWKREGRDHQWSSPDPKDGCSYTGLSDFLHTDRRTFKRALELAGVKPRRLRDRSRGYYPFTRDECERIIRAFYIALDRGIINPNCRKSMRR